jgi:hypothetical protein
MFVTREVTTPHLNFALPKRKKRGHSEIYGSTSNLLQDGNESDFLFRWCLKVARTISSDVNLKFAHSQDVELKAIFISSEAS